ASAFAVGTALAGVTPNLTDSSGAPVRDGSGGCVQTSGIEHPDCAPKKAEPAKPAAPAAPAAPATPAEPAKPAAPAAPAVAPASVKQAITIQAEALFDFDKYVLKPEGKKSIDEAIAKLAKVDVEMIIATGHTDSIGTDKYNQRLSERRANTVKEYMVSKGQAAAKITTLGKGETQPVATNKTKEGRAKNRRVDIEFKGVTQK
ncbi:MAG TPA: OmpA family protein, partial [Usitatibacteraceae bacterium]|nr:OmpA family protein [Usitatibacteraceae bacterium]